MDQGWMQEEGLGDEVDIRVILRPDIVRLFTEEFWKGLNVKLTEKLRMDGVLFANEALDMFYEETEIYQLW